MLPSLPPLPRIESASILCTHSHSRDPIHGYQSPPLPTLLLDIFDQFKYKIVLLEQSSLAEERFSKNGVQKNVHIVVKNTPFVIALASKDLDHFNFKNALIDVQLVYDTTSFKEVESVKMKPIESKLKHSDSGDVVNIEIRIKVLTSQLEDMFFRVRIAALDPITKSILPQYSILSHPIRVISKPDQLLKKTKKRKRAPTENLIDMLDRIEEQQKEQQRMLKRLCVGGTSNPQSSGTNYMRKFTLSLMVMLVGEQEGTKGGFRAAFTEFLSAFKQHPSLEDSTYKVFSSTLISHNLNKILTITIDKVNTSTQDAQTMCEILDLIRDELNIGNNKKDDELNTTIDMSNTTTDLSTIEYSNAHNISDIQDTNYSSIIDDNTNFDPIHDSTNYSYIANLEDSPPLPAVTASVIHQEEMTGEGTEGIASCNGGEGSLYVGIQEGKDELSPPPCVSPAVALQLCDILVCFNNF